MRPTARILALASLAWLGLAAAETPPAPATPAPAISAPAIGADELAAREATKDPTLVVLDVRTPAEYAEGHVPGAINVPHDAVAARLDELAPLKDKDVVVYCKSGRRAALALDVLGQNGYTRLRHLDGDMQGWVAAGRPVEKSPEGQKP
jgi:rhodanese-related sulfurtransferase